MPLTTGCKNDMLDAIDFDGVRLHSGDPGGAGTSNTVTAVLAATFAAASGGVRALSADVDVTGLSALQAVTYVSFWSDTQSVFRGSVAIGTGDVAANAAGEYSLTTGTTVSITDPA